MNNFPRFLLVLPSSRSITIIFQRLSKPKLIPNLYRSHRHQFHYPSARMFTSVCSNNITPLKDSSSSSSTSVSNEDRLDAKVITNGDPELEKKLKVLFLEVELMRQDGDKVPTTITNDQWNELAAMSTRSRRRKFLAFLWKKEKLKEGSKNKKEEKRKVREELLQQVKPAPDDGHIQYGLNRNTIFMRVYDTTVTHFDNWRLIQGMQFNQKLVVDCGYDVHMSLQESMNCAKQLMLLFAENRIHQDPFNLYFCNVNHNGHTMQELHKFIKTLYEDHFPLNITGKSYLDLFPKENLVYLTPHCREEMQAFDHDAVYIIGGIVDKVNKEPLSLAKAKEEGLRMAKLPLDRYLAWGSGGGKSLTLNQMIKILLDLRCTGDWRTALQHVPRRKIVQDEGENDHQFNNNQYFKKKVFSNYRTSSFN